MIPEIRRVGQRSFLVATAKQELFGKFLEGRLGDNYNWVFNSGTLAFESDRGRIECDTYPVASIAVEPATMLWRWFPLSEEEQSYFRPHVVQGYRDFGERNQLSSFTAQEVPYSPGHDQLAAIAQVGHDVIQVGYEIFGPEAVFYQAPFNQAGSRLVWALANFRDSNGPIQVPMPSLLTVMTKAPRLLDAADDPAWSLEGIPRHFTGVQCVLERFIPERRIVATYTTAAGARHVVDVTQDEHGRIEGVKMHLSPGE